MPRTPFHTSEPAVTTAGDLSPPWPSAAVARRTLAVIFVVAGLCTMDRLVINLVVDPIKIDLGISDVQMSLLQGLSFSLLYSFAGLPLGFAADRFSRRNLLLCGLVTWSLCTALGGLASGFGTFFVLRVLVGAGEAALWPVAVSLIGDLLPADRRGRAISLVLLGQIVGSSVALIGGGALLGFAAHGGFAGWPLLAGRSPWRVVLLLWGLLGVIGSAFLLTISEPARRTQRDKEPATGAGLTGLPAAWANRGRLIWPIYGAGFCIATAVYANTAWVPTFYLRRFALSPATLGPLLGAVGLGAGIAGTLLAGLLSDRAARRGDRAARIRLVQLTFLACLPGSFIAFAPGLVPAFALTALSGVAYPATGALLIIALQDFLPGTMRGIGMAMHTFVGNLLGASAGPWLAALATEHVFHDAASVGFSLALVDVPALVIGFGLLSLLRRRLPPPTAPVG